VTGRQNHFININLLSGSDDSIRTALGGFWNIFDSSFGLPRKVFKSFDPSSLYHPLGGVTLNMNPFFDRMIADYSLVTASSARLAIPSVKMPIRMVGNESMIPSDTHWNAILQGGTVGTSSYPGFFSARSFTDTNFHFEIPYRPLYIKENDYNNLNNYAVANFTYDYRRYLRTYQSLALEVADYTSLPNFYYILSHDLGYRDGESESVNNYVSAFGNVDSIALFKDTFSNYPPTYDLSSGDISSKGPLSTLTLPGPKSLIPAGVSYRDKLLNIEKYLTSSLVEFGIFDNVSGALDNVAGVSKNLYFNKTCQQRLFLESQDKINLMPYHIKLKLPFNETDKIFTSMIEEAGFENNLLNYIKQRFVDKRDSSANPMGRTNYIKHQTFVSSSMTEPGIEAALTNTERYHQIDLFAMISEIISNSSNSRPDDFYIVGGQKLERDEIINTDGVYRHSQTIPAFKLLDQVKDYIESDSIFTGDIQNINQFLDLAAEPRYNETIAYRIEKLEYSSGIKQNFYISHDQTSLNSTPNRDGFAIYDTQIKYGQRYGYTAYAYQLVYGYSYKFSNLIASRKIATQDVSGKTVYCLEFFDTRDGSTTSQLAFGASTTTSVLTNDLFTDAQITSDSPYLADFNFSIEPTIKIIEIPLVAKDVGVLDHPVKQLDIYPFQRMNDSQIIGFLLNLDTNHDKKFPIGLSRGDLEYKDDYLKSNDLIETDDITKSAAAPAHMIEVYRKTTKPTSISDFTNADLVSRKSLMIENSKYNLSNCIYEEKVLSNKKIYYAIRATNRNFTTGKIPYVIEAELIDDGGYKYCVFNELQEEDLTVNQNSQIDVSKQVKKIFQLIPNINQLQIDDSFADYGKPAFEQISNITIGTKEDSIFDKTFKIRLTSKKTGKKIDLNVTYKLNNM
jgi:hypothetical protein